MAGLVMATLYSVYVMLLYSFNGPSSVESNGVSIGNIVLVYYVGGTLGGLIVGGLWPLLRWRLGATLVGIVVAFVVFVGVIMASDGYASIWLPQTYRDAAIIACLVGSVAANLTWRRRI
jgi:hypothetical protein